MTTTFRMKCLKNVLAFQYGIIHAQVINLQRKGCKCNSLTLQNVIAACLLLTYSNLNLKSSFLDYIFAALSVWKGIDTEPNGLL